MAAVTGTDPDWDIVPAVLDRPEGAVFSAARSAVDACLLRGDAGVLRWRHALIREAVVDDLLAPERAALARGVAQALLTRGRRADLAHAAELLAAGGERQRAADLFVALARHDRTAGALRRAERLLDRADALGADPATTALERVGVLTLTGRVGTAVEVGAAALPSAAGAVHAELCLRLVRSAVIGRRWQEAQAYVERAGRPDDPRSLLLTADAAFGAGDVERAGRLAAAAVHCAERSRTPDVLCEALDVVGRAARLDDPAAARLAFTRAAILTDRPFALTWVTAPGADGTLVAAGRHRSTYGWDWDPRHDDLAAWPPERVTQRIRSAAGLPDLQLHLSGTFAWTFRADVATSFRSGHVFLVGDAATRTTPRRATGMNTGIAAAHNLAWKLAWVLRGRAGEALLDTYDQERRPVGRANAVRSLQQAADVREAADVEDFGAGYVSEAISPAAGNVPTGALAVPGERAPHAWIGMADRRVSTLDLFDGRFTVLTGPAGGGWRTAADRLAADGSPLAGVRFGVDLPDPDGALAYRYGVSAGAAVLVRPDGYVAWRSESAGPDADAVLTSALARATGRVPAPIA